MWLVCFRIETVGTDREATELCGLPARLRGGPDGWCGLPDATAGLVAVIPVLGSPCTFDSERTRAVSDQLVSDSVLARWGLATHAGDR